MYSRSNYEFLKNSSSINKIETIDISLSTVKKPIIRKLLIFVNSIFGYSSQETITSYNKITRHDAFKSSDIIWFDGSLCGKTLARLKKHYPSKVIVTAFHNIEKDFYNALFDNWKYLTLKRSALKSEYLSAKHSDISATITNEDGARLKNVYGKSASIILPILYEKPNICFDSKLRQSLKHDCELDYVLFVGSDFPPNIEALKYISEIISPIISKKVLVVGKGLEIYRDSYERKNVEIVGFVDDISPYYANAQAVITPIFSGAGMKIKVAEALSYGKTVIGTPFSFIGYPEYDNFPTVFKVAEDKLDFMKFISDLDQSVYNSASIEYFRTHFLHDKYLRKFNDIVDSILSNKEI
jgi:hypothetical protein